MKTHWKLFENDTASTTTTDNTDGQTERHAENTSRTKTH
jgi:hypothetical protein